MRTRWNSLRSGALMLLCSLALLIVCGGLVPIAVQAETPDTPVIDWDTVTRVQIYGESIFETTTDWRETGEMDEYGEPIEEYQTWYTYYDED